MLNVLTVTNQRLTSSMPIHFVSVTVKAEFLSVTNWIFKHLAGRFYIKRKMPDNSNQLIVGFEDSVELTIFLLSCPYYQGETHV